MSTSIRSIAQDQTGVQGILQRIQRDFLEMPGLCLTSRQVQRLWGLDAPSCEAVLDALVEQGVLSRTKRVYSLHQSQP